MHRGARGRGLHAAANLAIGSDTLIVALPITVVGHRGFERWSVYAGPGYTPYAGHAVGTSGDDGHTDARHGFHALAGARAGRTGSLSTSVDVLRQYLSGGVIATSITTALGVHF